MGAFRATFLKMKTLKKKQNRGKCFQDIFGKKFRKNPKGGPLGLK